MSSKEELQQQINDLQVQLNRLAGIAEGSDQELGNAINAQAQQLQSLTMLVVSMHRHLFPEKYDAEGKPIKTPTIIMP